MFDISFAYIIFLQIKKWTKIKPVEKLKVTKLIYIFCIIWK